MCPTSTQRSIRIRYGDNTMVEYSCYINYVHDLEQIPREGNNLQMRYYHICGCGLMCTSKQIYDHKQQLLKPKRASKFLL